MWREAWKLAWSVWSNGIALQQTAVASGDVIARRTETIGAAIRNPLDADVGELSLMVTEKVSAWSAAGATFAQDLIALQGDLLDHGSAVATAIALRPLSLATLDQLNTRALGLALDLSTAGSRSFEPVRATVTANQRRLSRRHAS